MMGYGIYFLERDQGQNRRTDQPGTKMPFRRRKTGNQPAKWSSSRRNSCPFGRKVVQPAKQPCGIKSGLQSY